MRSALSRRLLMEALLQTGGHLVGFDCRSTWLTTVVEEGAAGELVPAVAGLPVDVRVTVEDTSDPFDTAGWEVITRGAFGRSGQVVILDACSSGLDVAIRATPDDLEVRARWRPSLTGRAASALLRSRGRLLIREVLLQYPVIWWAGLRGRAPLHASVCGPTAPGGETVVLAGPGGVGKSTLVHAELANGVSATCDNLCVSDGRTAWGLVEPFRVDVGGLDGRPRGRRVPHGRRETTWPTRADSLTPSMVVVLRRGAGVPRVAPMDPDDACRALVAGTYMAGELRRFWGLAATLSLGTGLGEPHPRVEDVARQMTARLPCKEVFLGGSPGPRLGEMLDLQEIAEAWK